MARQLSPAARRLRRPRARRRVWQRAASSSNVVYGRAVQPIEGSMTYGVSEQLAELFRENVNGTLGSEIARRAALPPPNAEASGNGCWGAELVAVTFLNVW